MWRRLPSERSVAELYASSFLFKCADRRHSNLAQKSIGRQPTAQTSTDNRTAIKNEDTLLNMFESPIPLRAIPVREALSGKYRDVRKEVVSDFIKESIAWMGFLNGARK
jgi:hypothetical protein